MKGMPRRFHDQRPAPAHDRFAWLWLALDAVFAIGASSRVGAKILRGQGPLASGSTSPATQ